MKEKREEEKRKKKKRRRGGGRSRPKRYGTLDFWYGNQP